MPDGEGAGPDVDVLIVGAGPAGAAAALAFTRYTGLSVLLVDRSGEPGLALGELVTPGVLPLLDFIGVGEALTGDGHDPAQGVAAAWGTAEPMPRDFLFGARGMGWHLDRTRFNRRLALDAQRRGATVALSTRVAAVDPGDDGGRRWRVRLSGAGGARMVCPRLIVDAGGRAATVARRLGARRMAGDGLIGIAAIGRRTDAAAAADGFPATTLIEASPEGWWYSAPLPDRRLVVTLLTDADLARAGGLHHADAWHRALLSAPLTAARAGPCDPLTRPMLRAAHSQELAPVGGPGWLAAGDAAAAFDPISGLGIGHAIASGLHAARAGEASLRGDGSPMRQYARGVADNAARYRTSLAATYAGVTRFPDAPFWRRRAGHGIPDAAA